MNQQFTTVDCTAVPACTLKECVINGYPLPNLPKLSYVRTLWTINNETLNIWTHLLASIYFGWLLKIYSLEMDLLKQWPVLVIVISSIIVTLFSALTHTFHSRSELDHCFWLLIDFFGIVMFAFGSTVTHFFACSSLNFYLRFGYWNLAMLTFNCCVVYAILCTTKIPSKNSNKVALVLLRVFPLACGYFYGLLPILHRMCLEWSNPSLQFHLMSVLFMILSPFLYATNKPQYFFPGSLDIVGHNHQLFHMSINFMLYFDILAVYNDVSASSGHWHALKNQVDYPSLKNVSLFALLLFVWSCGVGYFTIKKIKKSLADKSK